MIDILGQRILKKGLISKDQLLQAVERQRLFGGRIGFNLVALGLISDSDLTNFFTFEPHLPNDPHETNLGIGFITDLILKHCAFLKKFNVIDLADRIKLPSSLILEIVTDLRRDRFIEVAKGDITLASTEYALTDAGINRAIQSLKTCRYAGPAPVSLEEYRHAIEIQTIKSVETTYKQLKDTFSKIVLSEDKLRTIGSAVNSSKPIFLYGPPGNGKTTIAEFIGKSLPGEIYIPYSILAGDQIIIVYDQVNHKAIRENNDATNLDQRWIKIKRPVVIAGGELTLQTLDLSFNADSKYYEAPLQMKANNGLFIVDDFGRQIVDPQSLLNRWIIPLDRQTDYLTLHTGMKFEIPFDQLVVFATNLPPKDIADEAFLRRLRYKIHIDYPKIAEYYRIFSNICNSNNIKYDEDVFKHLIKQYKNSKRNLSCCDPRDLIDQIIDFASFDKEPPQITNDTIDKAWANYFVK